MDPGGKEKKRRNFQFAGMPQKYIRLPNFDRFKACGFLSTLRLTHSFPCFDLL